MSSFVSFIKTFFAVVLAIFTSFASFSFPGGKKPDPNALQLSVAAVSDTHITKELYRRAVFVPGLEDISKNVKPDVFLCAGDCTDNGNEENWAAFQDTLEKHLNVDRKIIAIGNHDTWTSYDTPHDYEPAKQNYLKYANAIMGTDYTQVWFTYEVKGYTFIVMGSEGTSVGAELSDAQLQWVDAEMAKAAAAAPEKPIFVINHQPLNFTHAVGDNEHNSGISTEGASEKLQAIMDKYAHVFYISGHQHYGLNDGAQNFPEGFSTVEQVGEHITSINLPSYEYGSFITGGNAFIGQGLVINVYPNRVELLGRNFAVSNWVRNFSVTVPLD